MKESLPNKTDSIFKDEVNPDYGAWLKNPANKFFYIPRDIKKQVKNYGNSA